MTHQHTQQSCNLNHFSINMHKPVFCCISLNYPPPPMQKEEYALHRGGHSIDKPNQRNIILFTLVIFLNCKFILH